MLATPLLASECRSYVYDLARRLGVPVKGTGLADGIEVFPKHDAIAPGEFGNAIRGPLGIHRALTVDSGFTERITRWKPKSNF
jgi:hypothetical protein